MGGDLSPFLCTSHHLFLLWEWWFQTKLCGYVRAFFFFEDFNLVSSPFLSYISNPSIVRICHFKHVFSCPKYQTLIFSSYSLDSGYEDMNRQTLTLLRDRQTTNLSILLWMFYVLFMYCIIVYVYMLNWNIWMNEWMNEWINKNVNK